MDYDNPDPLYNQGERQVAPQTSGIRRDHTARYEWAAQRIPAGATVLDAACGVGYGCFILARHGLLRVTGVDRSPEALAYARQHYHDAESRQGPIEYRQGDLSTPAVWLEPARHFNVLVCFETIEHLRDPESFLNAMRGHADRLLVSVPNEAEFPFAEGIRHHYRHYTRAQLEELLRRAGWLPTSWHGQKGPESPVTPGAAGRTIIADCRKLNAFERVSGKVEPSAPQPRALMLAADHPRRAEIDAILDKAYEEARAIMEPPPAKVALLGLGPSIALYLDTAKRLGGRRKIADETWAINALGDVFAADRVFHMDDIRVQMARAAASPDSNIAAMVEWLRQHPGPIYTSTPHPEFPGMVEFPLEDVLNRVPFTYFNNTCSYAIAFAVFLGVKKLSLWGIDFTYPDAHSAEKGRGCVEFWLGYAAARGMQLEIAGTSTLMDANVAPAERWYGYDYDDLVLRQDGTRCRVDRVPRAKGPTAEEIEDRYDHGQHPAGELAGEPGAAA